MTTDHHRLALRGPTRRVTLGIAWLAAAVVACVSPATASAQGAPHQLPMAGKSLGTPMLMLNMSRDHQLSYRAYVEYTDLDGDGQLERTYKHSQTFDYYGYFDPYRCYTYSDGRFKPGSVTSDKYCSSAWSGNFLNWATMTRLDVVRRILYGGLRSTDDSSLTVLERAYLPTDAHSFAKYYAGADISKLTPFDVAELTMCNTTPGPTSGTESASHDNRQAPLMKVAAGNYQLWNNNERWQCYWSEERGASWTSNAEDKAKTGLDAEISNPSRDTNGLSVGGNGPNFIVRVEACKGATAASGSTEPCTAYPSGNRKPTGLLHDFGQDNKMLIGLMTGSYEKNISGGVLRANIGSFRDEVRADTDGRFKSDVYGIVHNLNQIRIFGYNYADGSYRAYDNDCTYQLIGLTDGRCRSWGNPMSEIYIESLRYLAGASSTSAYATSGGADATLNLQSPTWKDPFGPFKSSNPTPSSEKLPGVNQCSPLHVLNFNASVSSWDHASTADITSIGASATAAAWTRKVGDGEGLAGKTLPIGNNGSTADGLCTPKTITDLGTIHGLCPEAPTQQGTFLMAGAAYWARSDRIRTDLRDVPADLGALRPLRVNTLGVALATNTPVVRIPVPGSIGADGLVGPPTSTFVTLQPTYLLDLGSRKGNGTLVDFRVVYQDIRRGYGRFYVNWEDSEQGGDYDQDSSGYIKYWFSTDRKTLYVETLVTGYSSGNPQGFGYIINGTTTDGPRFHSGAASFSYTPAQSTNIYRAVSNSAGFESTLSASPINGVTGSRINADGGCSGCLSAGGWDTKEVDADDRGKPTVAVYSVRGTTGETLRDPMWYAAKWGGFNDLDRNGKPSGIAEWAPRNRQRPEYRGLSDADAAKVVSPDNFFFAANPGELPSALRQALSIVYGSASLSGMSVTSRLLVPQGGTPETRAYTATFTGDWTGDVLSYGFNASGQPADKGLSARSQLDSVAFGSRVIFTRNGTLGVKFDWASIDDDFRTSLRRDPRNSQIDDVDVGRARLDWLRGDKSGEVQNGGLMRNRTSRLADIVNSTPLPVGPPRMLQRIGAPLPGYAAFRSDHKNRMPMVYVGSNGGMLHGFEADTMRERFAFVPRALRGKLSALTDPGYAHQFYVDGTPFVADVSLSGTWRTVLFGSLGAGGRGVYALDVTRPASIGASSADTVVMWEFSSDDDPDFGYVIGQASERADFQPNQVVKLADGNYWLVVGNGVASTNGKAYLFLLRVSGPGSSGWAAGSSYIKIEVSDQTDNGLAMPFLVDGDGDGTIDTGYAGDLRGNLWKFDLSSTSPSAWATAAGKGSPLFTAKSAANAAQPITAAPVAARLDPRIGGTFVVFGTGKLYELADLETSTAQSVYGIWDNGTSTAVAKNTLVKQDIIAAAGASADYRDLSSKDVCLSAGQAGCLTVTAFKRGWYIDLPSGGSTPSERMVFNPTIDAGADLLLTTTVPGGNEGCGGDGTTWYMRMALASGASLKVPLYDTNGDRYLDTRDAVTSGAKRPGIRKSGRLLQKFVGCTGADCPPPGCLLAQGDATGAVGNDVTRCPRVDTGRLNWREIVR
jgi:type IV pilus assembly protein PilY1